MSKLPDLYKKTATGAIQLWQVSVEGATIVTTFGQVDGQMQTVRDPIKSGKNQGRKNETGAEEQAKKEAQSRWEKKKKSGYVGSIQSAKKGEVDDLIQGGISPMLAKVFEEHSKKIPIEKIAVQPKLDGGRMIAMIDEFHNVTLWTRTRKRIYSMEHIVLSLGKAAKKLKWKNVVLDGEAYNHDLKDKFESLMSAFRKSYTTSESETLQYHIYDVVSTEGFFERYRFLVDLEDLNGADDNLIVVETVFTNGLEYVDVLHEEFVDMGYEGAMIRILGRPYENKRSDQLLKLKKFQDDEFPIVGAEEGRGKLIGHCGSFICTTKSGEKFNVKMSGETKKLKEYWQNKDKYIGKMLTVQFQSLTGYGAPRFPVGIRIRESQDT